MTKTKVRFFPHERELLASGELTNISHGNSKSVWLFALSDTFIEEQRKDQPHNKRRELCYRHMGDIELLHLLQYKKLPDTQPYQTLTNCQERRAYCESYLRTNKYVDTYPTTIVEFNCRKDMIDEFYSIQCKPEDVTRLGIQSERDTVKGRSRACSW